MFGFTEPYFLDKPIQLGFTVFTPQLQIQPGPAGQHLLGPEAESAHRLSEFAAELFAVEHRLYGFDQLSAAPLIQALRPDLLVRYFVHYHILDGIPEYFEFLAFRNVGGANALQGIQTSKLVPSFSLSTIDNPMRPHSGHSYFVGMDIAGIGGNVADIRPIGEYKVVHSDEGLPSEEGRHADAGLPSPGIVHHRLGRQDGASLRTLLPGRRHRPARL